MTKLLATTCVLALMCSPAFANDMVKDKGMMKDHFRMMDRNGDGTVSRAEHDAYAAHMFDAADTNHDGKMSMDEMATHKKKMHAMHRNADGARADTRSLNERQLNNMNTGSGGYNY